MKIYTKADNVKYFSIRKKDLLDLTELITQGFPPEAHIYISTHVDTVSIEENSIEAFISHKEIPDLLKKYKIYVVKFESSHTEKMVILDIYSKSETAAAHPAASRRGIQGAAA